jgi:tripartite-type tricarboxylate transporter receptor subunit TctC
MTFIDRKRVSRATLQLPYKTLRTPLKITRMARVLILAVTIGWFGLSLHPVQTQAQTWPQRTVRVIVPLPPGNSLDVSGRLFAEQLSSRWKQPVVVENIAGADGVLAAKEFVSRHDDHTLLDAFAGLITINPLLYEKLPYDPKRDLVPVAMTTDNFIAIATSEKLNVGSLADLLKFARSRQVKLNWAATAGLPYFAFAGFLKGIDVEMTYVPYRDFNPALSDVGEGRIEFVATGLTQLIPHAQAGRIRVLALLNPTRAAIAPQVPTATEAGYPALTFEAVAGFFGWREMPSELRNRIAADVRLVTENQTVRDRLPPMGIVAKSGSADEFAAAIEAQGRKVAAIAAAIGTKPIE